MLYYTIVPPEQLFAGMDEYDPQYISIQRGGVEMLVEPMGSGLCEIRRILSTDPQHYLDPGLQPGTHITVSF